MNQTHPGKYNRSVSIIGVGCTPFMYTVDNPETDGLTEGEMFGYAALKAMEDAGITAKDVEFYFHGVANPLAGMGYLTPNAQIANWFGMKGRASIHHSEACCTGYLALEQAHSNSSQTAHAIFHQVNNPDIAPPPTGSAFYIPLDNHGESSAVPETLYHTVQSFVKAQRRRHESSNPSQYFFPGLPRTFR